jgi:hypothetical protein
MSAKPQRFKEREAARLIRAVTKAGASASCVEVDGTGKIRVVFGPPATEPRADTKNEWDGVLE